MAIWKVSTKNEAPRSKLRGIYPSHRSPHSRSKLRGSGPSFGIKKDKEAFDSANADQQDIANEGIKRLLNIEE
jgi:hypothetical protein